MKHCKNCGEYILRYLLDTWFHVNDHRHCYLGLENGVRVFSDDVAEPCEAGDLSNDEAAGVETGLW
jgi:hypothetical protein